MFLAKAVNCLEPIDGNPCNHCRACRAIDSGACMDVLEIDAASNNGVDQVRSLRDDAIYTPSEVSRRVYIIDEVHMLSLAAFNALLKIIEEPPAHLMFILATTELHKVPATILSRCQRFSFRRLLQEDIAGRLNFIAYEEGIDLEPEACRLLARLADGALRDGISLLDQCASAADGAVTAELVYSTLGLAGEKRTAQLMEAFSRHDAKTALELFSGLYAGGKDIAAMIDELTALSRDLLILKTAPRSGLTMLSGVVTDREALALVDRLTPAELLRFTTILQETASGFAKSANRRIDAELCLLRLCNPGLDLDAGSLNARVSRLEDQIASGQLVRAAAAPAEPEEERPPLPDDEDVPPPREEDAPPVPPLHQAAPTGFEADFFARLTPELPMRCRGFLNPNGAVKLRLEGDQLLLVAPREFEKKQVDTPPILEASARVASALLGRPIRVRVVVRSKNQAAPDGEQAFRALMEFGGQHSDVIQINQP